MKKTETAGTGIPKKWTVKSCGSLIALCGILFMSSHGHAAEVSFRLTLKNDVLQGYYDQPDAFPVSREKLDYISFSTGVDDLIRDDGERLFSTTEATAEIFKGSGPNYAFNGQETVDAIRKYEDKGLNVAYAIIYREDWLYLNGGGPWEEDIRILSAKELADVRAALAASNLRSKDTVKLIQLVGIRVQKYRGDTWYQIRENPTLMAHLANFDGIGTECHVGDHNATIDDGPQTLDCMALITKWARDNQKTGFVFMGGAAGSYTQVASMRATYDYLWDKMDDLGIEKNSHDLLYFRQGARPGTHLPESSSSLTFQLKELILNVENNTAIVAAPTISAITDQQTPENTPILIPFTVGDADSGPDGLSMVGSSSNTNVLPNSNIVFGGTGANRSVTLSPVIGSTGSTLLTLVVSDGVLSATNTFELAVTSPDSDGDGISDADEIASGRNPTNAADLGFEFNTDGSFEGWEQFNNITSPIVSGGSLSGTGTGDAQFRQDYFLFPASDAPYVIIKFKATAASTLQLFWGHTIAGGFAAARRINIPYSASSDWQAIIVPTSTHAEWIGKTITALRIDPAGSNGVFFEIDWIRASDGDLDDDGILDMDEDGGDSDGDGLLDLEDPIGAYEQWALLNDVSGGKMADDDHDGLFNIYEYGLGGNPTNGTIDGHIPTFGIVSNGFEYVHMKRSAADSGITYTVETCTNLVSGTWSTQGVEVTGAGSVNAEFNAVTNRISTEAENEQFIRLIIQ